MNKIDTSSWKEFSLCDLFEITGSTTTPKNDLEFNDSYGYPYVTTAATNNGIAGFSDIYTEEGNVLTVDSAVIGTTFYQKDNFTASDHVEKLIPKFELNENIGKFLVAVMNQNAKIFDYAYNNKRSQTALREETIKLPVDLNGNPDWKYMESYMESISKKVQRFINDLKSINDSKNRIDISNWKKFKIGELFSVSRGKRFVVGKHIEGDIPYYSASLDNNGITDYISNPIFVDSNAIVVTTFGDAFYAKNDFTASDEITILHHEKLNELNGLFISSAIRSNKWKYSFKVKAFMGRLLEDEIFLPKDEEGNPDWKYMEEYMKKIIKISKAKYYKFSLL